LQNGIEGILPRLYFLAVQALIKHALDLTPRNPREDTPRILTIKNCAASPAKMFAMERPVIISTMQVEPTVGSIGKPTGRGTLSGCSERNVETIKSFSETIFAGKASMQGIQLSSLLSI
jgi:hypothetical protein